MAPPDDELNRIRNSLAGDTEAFATLVKQYQKMVHALAFRMTGCSQIISFRSNLL